MIEKLDARGAQWLIEHDFGETEWIVEGLLPLGLSMIVSPPKFGKSFLMLNLGLHVVAGEPFWGLLTTRSPVLYLALEDTFKRVGNRLELITEQTDDDFEIAVRSSNIGGGLIDQLETYMAEHPDTKLVMLDTLQIVRNSIYDNAYSADYSDLRVLKEFADSHSIALMVVHHTRKARYPDDVFANISGTNGLMGACDTVFVLDKDRRSDRYATLSVTGRDVEFQELRLLFREGEWEFVERLSDGDFDEPEVPGCIQAVADFMERRQENWAGTASELLGLLDCGAVRSSVLGRHLGTYRDYLTGRGIKCVRERTGAARTIRLELIEHDANDGPDGKSDISSMPSDDGWGCVDKPVIAALPS